MLELMSEFADWLIAQMNDRGWSQSEMARRSGLTRQAISYYLTGKSKDPDREALYKIAHAFKMPPLTVLKAAKVIPFDPQSDEWVDEQLHKLKQIPPEMRPAAGRVIASFVEEEKTPRPARQSPKVRPANS